MNAKDPLFISKSNKRGLIIFMVLSLVVVFLPRIAILIESDSRYAVKSEEVKRLTVARNQYERKFQFKRFLVRKKVFYPPSCRFDPNKYDLKDWERLGLTPKQSSVVVKFCSRGIYSNDQLQKIFVIPEQLFQLIKDSTFYPIKTLDQTKHTSEKRDYTEKLTLVDLNRADEQELDKVPGIGPFYAKNIVKYRNRLGGFNSKEQLLEVWKMDPIKYEEIERFLFVDPSAIVIMNLNSVGVDQLRKHPYFNWNIANSIVKFRAQKKTFSSIEDIKESVLIDEELFEKIKPYLTL